MKPMVASAVGVCLAALALWAISAQQARGDNPPRENNRELHVVGVHVGATKTNGAIHGPRAVVTVDRPKKLVTLVLAAYNPITWEIKIAPGSSVEKVILGGYHRQAVEGTPASTEIVNAAREGGSGELSYCRNIDSAQFSSFAHQLAKLTELEISSFFGTYLFAPEFPIVVNATQDDPRLLRSYPQPMPPAKIPKAEFKALRYSADPLRPFIAASAEWGDFSFGGPEGASLKLLPTGVKRLALDPQGQRHYGIAGNDVVEVDLLQLSTKKLEPGQDLPRINHASDLTYDSRRKRLLVAGEYLFAFEPATGRWSVLAERPEVAAVAYHAPLDRLFAVSIPYSEEGNLLYLCEFNMNGALLRQTEVTGPLVPGSFGRPGFPNSAPLQLIAAGEHLALLISSQTGRGETPLPKVAYCYLIDPATAKASLTWKEAQP